MNEQLFKQQLGQLSETEWQSLAEGESLIIKEDKEFFFGDSSSPNAILRSTEFDFINAFDLKKQVLENAGVILANYYRTTPLTLVGFNQQVEELLKKYGVEEFCAPIGSTSNRTLFVEGGEVIAESAESPRHPYGVFFEMKKPMPEEIMQSAVYKWLSSGEAHERYIGMNVCRYNC